MKRVRGLYPRIVTWDNMALAAFKAACGKRDRLATRAFFEAFDDEIASLLEELRKGEVCVGSYTRFTIRDPKEREICAPCFRERVLHHALMNVCEPFFEKRLVFDTYACRIGKGQLAAVRRASAFGRRYPFFLKMDVKRFFHSVNHLTLLRLLERLFREAELLEIFRQIIDAYEKTPGRGLPIGALTSQHFANYYLSPFDGFVKETLRCPAYVRYMDDMLLWGKTARELKERRNRVAEFLGSQLLLDLKSEPFINRSVHGVDFLGYRIYPCGVALSRRSKRRFYRKVRGLERAVEAGRLPERDAQVRLQAVFAFARPAELSRAFRHRVLFGDKKTLGKSRRLETGQPRRQLEQPRQELPLREPEQEQPVQPEQQPWLSCGRSSADWWDNQTD